MDKRSKLTLPVPKEIAVDEVEVVVEDEVIFTQYFTHLLNIYSIFYSYLRWRWI